MASDKYMASASVTRILKRISVELRSKQPANPEDHIRNMLQVEDAFSSEDLIKSVEDASRAKFEDRLYFLLKKVKQFMKCKHQNLYLVDESSQSFILSNHSIKQANSFGNGFPDACRNERTFISVSNSQGKDVTKDPRFCETYYRNLNIDKFDCVYLCPILADGIYDPDKKQKVVGILECINHINGEKEFSDQEMEAARVLTSQMGSIFTLNSFLEHCAMEHKREAEVRGALTDLIKTIGLADRRQLSLNSLLFTMTRRTQQICQADRATLFLVDHSQQNMWTIQGEVNIIIPLNRGIAGTCGTKGEVVNIPDAYKDKRFDSSFDKKTGYKTTSILCIPMKTQAGKVIGVLQLINKLVGTFTVEDEQLLSTILESAAPGFERAQMKFKPPELKNKKNKSKFMDKMPQKSMSKTKTSKLGRGSLEFEPIMEEMCPSLYD